MITVYEESYSQEGSPDYQRWCSQAAERLKDFWIGKSYYYNGKDLENVYSALKSKETNVATESSKGKASNSVLQAIESYFVSNNILAAFEGD